jgi:hypothetical protein
LDYKNKSYKGNIKGIEKSFFRIWLSDNPVDKDLKDALLVKLRKTIFYKFLKQ